jgi:hypothetical protein
MPRKTKWLLLPALAVAFLSCSRSEPRIAYGSIRLVYYQGEEGPEERFSLFVLPEDDDGVEDLDSLTLYHDREGLVWSLPAEEWIALEIEGETWVGSRHIAMLDGGPLPRGQFRAVLTDKGGEHSERRLVFDAPRDSRYSFPFFSIEQGIYRIDSEYPEHSLLCYDAEGNYLLTKPLTALEGSLEELRLGREVRTVALWAEDGEYFTSALTDPVFLD